MFFFLSDGVEDSLGVEHERPKSLQRQKRFLPALALAVAGALIGVGAMVIKDQILDDVKAAAPNQCKVSYAHVGTAPAPIEFSGGFDAEFVTLDGDINSNNEKLDGRGLGTDSTRETMSTAQHLNFVRFKPYRNPPYYPCIVAITINCGNQVLSGGGYTSIGYQDMLNAWFRVGFRREIDKQELETTCVRFDPTGQTNSFKGMTVSAEALKCETDRDCIQRHIEMW